MWEGERLRAERRAMTAPLSEKMTNKANHMKDTKVPGEKLVNSKCHPFKLVITPTI